MDVRSLWRSTRHTRSNIPFTGSWGMAEWLLLAGLGLTAYAAVQRLRLRSLRGRRVLITGGSRGLGFLLAREFGRKGARVAICARDPATLAEAQRRLRREGVDVLALAADVADPDQIRDVVEATAAHLGGIDILVNNAGIMQVAPVTAVDEADFAHALDIMFWGPLRTSLAVLPQMRARGEGQIVNITSIGGVVSVPHMLPYACAKFAAVGLSQGLHAELAREGIAVTTIVPGPMRVGSHLNVDFRGRHELEFAWFALAASVPLLSISAERAARQIVQAAQRREAVRMIGLPAKVLERVHGLMPGTIGNMLGLVNRGLPDPVPNLSDRRGMVVQQQMRSRLLDLLTSLGRNAARRTNQF